MKKLLLITALLSYFTGYTQSVDSTHDALKKTEYLQAKRAFHKARRDNIYKGFEVGANVGAAKLLLYNNMFDEKFKIGFAYILTGGYQFGRLSAGVDYTSIDRISSGTPPAVYGWQTVFRSLHFFSLYANYHTAYGLYFGLNGGYSAYMVRSVTPVVKGKSIELLKPYNDVIAGGQIGFTHTLYKGLAYNFQVSTHAFIGGVIDHFYTPITAGLHYQFK